MAEEMKKVKVSVYLPPESYQLLEALSDFSGINKSALAAMAAQAGIPSLDKVLRGKKFAKEIKELKSEKSSSFAKASGA